MKHIATTFLILSFISTIIAQDDSTYQFSIIKDIQTTSVKDQGRSGTCWSYSTSSFLESELIRQGKGNTDLAEMFVVRNIYKEKAKNYVQRQGKANFSEGSLAHDLLNAIASYGAIPELAYEGKNYKSKKHRHSEMFSILEGLLSAIIKNKNGELSTQWISAFDGILNAYLGTPPETFTFQGISYNPKSFAKDFMGFDRNSYITLTSFKNEINYEKCILNIPDNFSNGSSYNLPLNELKEVIDYAITNGYTAVWDCDVSEKAFSGIKGIAIVPEKDWKDKNKNEKRQTCVVPEEEMEITPEFRLEEFLNQNTTDDHLMHITGIANDQFGNQYYIVKNSWSNKKGIDGYVYASTSYFMLKTISITLHKEGLPKKTKKLLGL